MSEVSENERSLSEVLSEVDENERSFDKKMSEVLGEGDYKKVKELIVYLDKNKSITPSEALNITGKSVATVRRYLNILVNTGFVNKEGRTNNIKYVLK